MAEVFNSKLDEAKSSLLKTIQLAKLYGSEEMQSPNFYKKLVNDFCEIKTKSASSHDTIQKASKSDSLAEFDKILNKRTSINRNAESKKFMDEIQQMLILPAATASRTEIYEDEDIVMENTVSDIDPLTKRKIVNPVKNLKCKHVYDKTSILEAIKLNPRLRCPVAGCGSKDSVKIVDLVDDIQFRNHLQNSL